jgi:hypothetical protein
MVREDHGVRPGETRKDFKWDFADMETTMLMVAKLAGNVVLITLVSS